MIFETERLLIRNWMPESDAVYAFAIYSDPDVTGFIGSMIEESVESQKVRLQKIVTRFAEINNGTGFWAILQKDSGEVIGASLLKQLPDNENNLTNNYEVGWHLRKASWGKGFATEAGKGAIEYGLTVLNLPTIYAVAHPENYASIRVMQRLNMISMGRTNKYYGMETELYKLDAPF
ncbi:MAG: GNAT family N-acetyltransferase [Scytonematopsis contorta HA4267-MV1]|jgi:RimJ/RimL family protein N-acetyltransferase|nr:GNAT family N-acetyltransferase [Scytonematopsis contorta HA4267-MV1]